MNIANEKNSLYEINQIKEFQLEYSHDEIIKNLSCDETDEFIKIFSIINLDKINSIDEARIIFYHLTEHTTPLREITAIKLEDIYNDDIFDDYIKKQFLKSIIDMNPNVCRAIVGLLSRCEKIKYILELEVIKNTKDLLEDIRKNDRELGSFYSGALKIRKTHAKNKRLFPLYWYLESLYVLLTNKNNAQVLEILSETIKFNSYTIREKTAKILVKLGISKQELLQIAKSEQNFYVKNIVYAKINNED